MKSHFSRITIVSTLCIAAFVVYGMEYAALSAKSTIAANLQNKIIAKTETLNRISAARATLASIADDEAMVQSYFVPEAHVVAFIDSLQAHGKNLGTAVTVISVSKGGTSDKPSLILALTIQGTFDAVLRTVGSIEHLPYDLSVSALEVGQDVKDSWHADLKLLVGSRVASSTALTL